LAYDILSTVMIIKVEYTLLVTKLYMYYIYPYCNINIAITRNIRYQLFVNFR
jgi:hypothetical protein